MSKEGSCAIVAERKAWWRWRRPRKDWLARWIASNVPTREGIEANRFLRPIAHRVLDPALWRWTRRSVPRGVALGMVTGILVPMGQMPASAVLALPLRANIPAAALTTLITNPLTTPPLWVAAYWVGRFMLRIDAHAGAPVKAAADAGWLRWLVAEAGPATALGLLTITTVLAIVGYAATALFWRWRLVRKWRKRHTRATLS